MGVWGRRGDLCLPVRHAFFHSFWQALCNTNKQERLNGGLAGRFRYARGINKEESLIFRMAILHYNYIKPHGGIAYGTPAEAAGIDIRGADRWLTLIQNAVSAA